MANPQAEEGHIDIANEIAEALMRVNLSSYETRVLWFLFRKTYGWKKKSDKIALSQFSKCIGIDRRLVHRAIKALSSKKMIVIYKDDRGVLSYEFQKDYEKWEVSSKKMTVIGTDDKVSSNQIPTKDTTKDKRKDTTYLVGQPADGKPKHPNCPHQEIVTAYNDTLGHLLPPARLSLWPNSAGAANLQARWKENEKRRRIEFWKGLFEYIRDECPFLIGQGGSNGGKPWKADLRWIVKRENLIKIQEGRYARQ